MTISLLGCGWLGLPLAEAMIGEGFEVRGSTTTAEKLQILRDAGIEPYALSLGTSGLNGDAKNFLAKADMLIIDIPPKLKQGNFTDKIKMLIPHIEKSGIRKVLFVSSVSVYGNNQGIVTEDTKPLPDTENGKQLLEVEQLLLANDHFNTTILRFGGLIGGERHPVYQLAGKENLPGSAAPVNLIHRDDCISIIQAIVQKDIWGEVFNAVAPHHPSREEYYTRKAIELRLPLPLFVTQNASLGKTVSSLKIKQGAGYIFRGHI
ncbi:NAD(P)H-binding protein [uncultured Flavobacterium sp.]|uniref:NAD(P)H-binding protein n=1 Tax=uncultured Flavobacterium sp. TaxID=165435 RepID=UPI0025E988CE|nr:NAD(P)H-binding protein [uncultured Flavobacterium sp.]